MNTYNLYNELEKQWITWQKRLEAINKEREKLNLPSITLDWLRHKVMKEKKKIMSLPKDISEQSQKDLADIIDEDLIEIEGKKEEVETKSKYKELLIRFNDLQDQVETIAEVKKHKTKFHKIESNKEKSEATAVWVASDWHIDEIIDPDTINQMNSFNPTIAEERVKKFFANGLKLTDIMSKEISIENILIAVLWDMISWYIHPELIENNADSPTQALIRFRNLLISWINYILDNSKYKITLVCKMGNHWRTTDKKRVSTSYKNSFEWLIYHLIANEYKDNPRVNFVVENWYHTYFKVYQYTLRMHHWDGMKFGWWVGWLTIPVNKSIWQWNKWRKADVDVFWHFHTQMFHRDFVSNWSLVWFNAYAESIKADYEEPQQAFFLMDRDRGKTIQSPIFLT